VAIDEGNERDVAITSGAKTIVGPRVISGASTTLAAGELGREHDQWGIELEKD